ncbi:MAG: hypothetical protein Q9217_000947 [Psora testacea]
MWAPRGTDNEPMAYALLCAITVSTSRLIYIRLSSVSKLEAGLVQIIQIEDFPIACNIVSALTDRLPANPMHFLGPLLCLAAVALSAPTPEARVSVPTELDPHQSLNGSDPGITCKSGPTYLLGHDCWTAINKFPNDERGDPIPATFSKYALKPRWQLPNAQVFGSCLAIVELGFFPEERSTWAAIRAELIMVYKSCVVGGRPGGYASLGELGGITVSLQPVKAPPPLQMVKRPPQVGQVETS